MLHDLTVYFFVSIASLSPPNNAELLSASSITSLFLAEGTKVALLWLLYQRVSISPQPGSTSPPPGFAQRVISWDRGSSYCLERDTPFRGCLSECRETFTQPAQQHCHDSNTYWWGKGIMKTLKWEYIQTDFQKRPTLLLYHIHLKHTKIERPEISNETNKKTANKLERFCLTWVHNVWQRE